MTDEEKCEWLWNILSHHEVYERIADEYDEDVNDFGEGDSCIDFSVTSIEMIFRSFYRDFRRMLRVFCGFF